MYKALHNGLQTNMREIKHSLRQGLIKYQTVDIYYRYLFTWEGWLQPIVWR